MASSSNLKEKKTRHAPTARQKSTRTAGRVVAPAASIVPAGTIANKDAPEKSLVLRAPLNREHALKSLDETVAKLRQGSETVTSFLVVLEQWSAILAAEWRRESETPSGNKIPSYIT